MVILLLFLCGITIVVLMITSAKMIAESEYEIRKEEERQRKEKMKRFEEEFEADMKIFNYFSKYKDI